MRNLATALICAANVLICPLAGAANDDPVIRGVSDLNRVIWDMVVKREEKRDLRWNGDISTTAIESLIRSSVVTDCADRWYYRYRDNGQGVEFRLELKESMYILAAYLDPRLANRLNPVERSALKLMKSRIQKMGLKTLPRKLKIIRFMDDLALNYEKTYGREARKTARNAFALSLYNYSGSERMMSEYIQIMMGALAVPCRTEGFIKKCVQLEDGEWYAISPKYPYFSESSPSYDEETETRNRVARDGDAGASLLAEYKVYESAVEFWEAAEVSSNAGDQTMEGFVKKYPGARQFMKAYEQHIADGGTVTVSDKYLPSRNGAHVYVSVTFNHDDEEPEAKPKSSTKKSSILDKDQDGKKRFKKLSS